jgi:hypothetical protein
MPPSADVAKIYVIDGPFAGYGNAGTVKGTCSSTPAPG